MRGCSNRDIPKKRNEEASLIMHHALLVGDSFPAMQTQCLIYLRSVD